MHKVVRIMEATGLNQSQLAEAIGVSQPTIHYMSKGRSTRGMIDYLIRILDSLCVVDADLARMALTLELNWHLLSTLDRFFKGKDVREVHHYVGLRGSDNVTQGRLSVTLGIIAAFLPDRHAEMLRTFEHVTAIKGNLLTYAERADDRKHRKKQPKRR